jgi:hypothetical protein
LGHKLTIEFTKVNDHKLGKGGFVFYNLRSCLVTKRIQIKVVSKKP